MQRIRTTILLAALAVAAAACQDRSSSPVSVPDLATPAAARAEFGEGYVLGRDGKPLHVTYEIVRGRAIWEGDIDLGPAASIPRTARAVRAGGPRLGVTINGVMGGARWSGGVVPYSIDAAVPSQSRITNAIAAIEAATNVVDFITRSTQPDYVRISVLPAPSTGCSSAVGRQGGQQVLYLDSNCTSGQVQHELLHALGMDHEHNRCDRDTYVRIDTANIDPLRLGNFTRQCSGFTDYGSYDEGSIMHYPANAFAINTSQPTIISLRGLAGSMGQRTALSAADIATVDWMYPTPPAAAIVTSVSTNPSPAVQYLPNTLTINGSNFDVAGVEVKVTGAGSCPTACTPNSFTSKTSTQLVLANFALSIPGTYQVWVKNPANGYWSGGQTVTFRPI